jgi:hypothetical protein
MKIELSWLWVGKNGLVDEKNKNENIIEVIKNDKFLRAVFIGKTIA